MPSRSLTTFANNCGTGSISEIKTVPQVTKLQHYPLIAFSFTGSELPSPTLVHRLKTNVIIKFQNKIKCQHALFVSTFMYWPVGGVGACVFQGILYQTLLATPSTVLLIKQLVT